MTQPDWLDRLEVRLGVNLRAAATHGGWVTLRYACLAALSLLVSVSFARLGTPELYGQYQLVLSILALLSFLTLPGLNTLSLRAIAQGAPGMLRRATRLSFSLAAGAGLLGAGYAALLLARGETELGWALAVGSLALPFVYGPNAWYTYYEGRRDFRHPSLRVVALSAIASSLIVVGLRLDWPLVGLVATFVGTSGLLTSLYYWEVRPKLGPPAPTLDLGLALRYTLQKVSATLPDAIQPMVIVAVFDVVTLGFFTIAYTVANAASGFLAALAATYFPSLVTARRLNHRPVLLGQLGLGIIIALGYWLIVRLGFLPLFGTEVGPSYQLALLLTPIIGLLPLRQYLVTFLTAKGAPSGTIWANLSSLALAIVWLLASSQLGSLPALVGYLAVLHGTAILILLGAYYDWHRRHEQS